MSEKQEPKAKAAIKPKAKAENLSITNLSDMGLLASDLGRFIKENKLFQNIQGKEYVNVEGWMYAGSRLQIVPRCIACNDVSTGDEIKYNAQVELYDMNQKIIVGQGFAVCSNREQGKKYYQEFAISSMSQTRATGKAFRNVLAFLIRMAGFEPTPAEEMDYGGNEPAKKAEAKAATKPAEVTMDEAAEAAQAAAIKYASAKQKEEIIRLLNNPVITRQEKTKMLLNINKLDEARASQAIDKLKKVIEEREDGQATSA